MSSTVDLAEVEAAVSAALRAGNPSGLHILGYGEITLVVGWPADSPQWALKRLPVFDDAERVRAYKRVFVQYLEELNARGVSTVESEFAWVESPSGKLAAYVIQPVFRSEELLVSTLSSEVEEGPSGLLKTLVELIAGAVDDKVGLDAQVSNWALSGGSLRYFDVSTPLMRDPEGRYSLDVDVFLASLPAALRLPVKSFLVDSILATYFNLRSVLVDVTANFYKDGIDRLIPVMLEVIGDRVSPAITPGEVYRYHKRDALLWSSLQRARKADRFWQRHIRRRTYPYLLPPSAYAGRRA